jgi:serine/threonine protein kinase/Tol biopolymer transport system component
VSDVDAAHWARIKEVFSAALARVPDHREAFLRETCGEDAALLDEVRSLLAAHAAADGFADGAAFDRLPVQRIGLAAGADIGVFRIVAPLDAGGMGEVYRALDTRLHREVALKVLPTAFGKDAGRVTRLAREARLLATLNHPHIATIHGFEIAGELHALVMELVEGPTLANRLHDGALAIETALDLARQIAAALEAAHEKGIVHRDLKPANIKVTGESQIKVLDFGLAETASEPGASVEANALGTEAMLAGTPGYMSPEQTRGERADVRSDIWAFGCVVYEMLTGRAAFVGDTLAETFDATREREPAWDQLPPRLPPAIRRMLRRCLAKDRRNRLQHIGDARLELADAADEFASDLEPATRRPLRRSAGLWLTAIVIGAILLTVMLSQRGFAPRVTTPEQRVVEITTPHGSDPASFALSPDGRRIAFVADQDGTPALWVRALDTGDTRALAGTDGARRPFWSPDSRSIGFFQNSEMRRVESRGGSVQTVTYALAGEAASWGPDGTILFSSAPARALRRVNAAGGTSEEVATPAAHTTGHRHPHFLPGGRKFLFFAGGADDIRGVYLGTLGSSEVIRLAVADTQGAFVAPDKLVFMRQGALLAQRIDVARQTIVGEPVTIADSVSFEPVTGIGAFSTSDSGVMAYRAARPALTRLTWFDRGGKVQGTFGTAEQHGVSNVRLAPDGRRAAAEQTQRNETGIWLLDGAHKTRLTRGADAGAERLPMWSPDGARIAFESVRSGSIALSVKAANGDGPEEKWFESPGTKIPCDWAPDGRALLYYVPDPITGTDLWLLPTDTRQPVLFLRTEANELWGQFSPDGRWVAYQSNETGRYEIYVRAFEPGGGAMPVSIGGGVYPRWARDGSELYFIAPDAKLMVSAIRTTAARIEIGVPETLFQTHRLGGGRNVIGHGHQYDVTADGRFLINVDLETTSLPITLLMNWEP